MSMNVFIEGNRDHFVSKAAVDKFKKEARETAILDTIDISKYLKDGFTFKFTKTETSITATIAGIIDNVIDNNNIVIDNIIDTVKNNVNSNLIDDKRKILRERLKNARRVRGGEQFKQLESLKRTVPDKLYKSYTNLIKTYAMPNIPTPLEAIENPEKYRQQISMVMGMKGMVSNEPRANSAIKKYFNELGQFLGIEAIEINMPTNEPFIQSPNINNSDTEDDDDDNFEHIKTKD
jgi:hypothetical protein